MSKVPDTLLTSDAWGGVASSAGLLRPLKSGILAPLNVIVGTCHGGVLKC